MATPQPSGLHDAPERRAVRCITPPCLVCMFRSLYVDLARALPVVLKVHQRSLSVRRAFLVNGKLCLLRHSRMQGAPPLPRARLLV